MKKSIIYLCIFLFLSSCQRENIDEFTGSTQTNLPNVFVNSSVIGLISDENGDPLADAFVSLGSYTTTSNEAGLFSIENELIRKNSAYIQVEKEGYFNGSRKFSTELDGQANIRIQLLEKERIDVISSELGGIVSEESFSIELPQGSYMNEAGESFDGTIGVYAKWLDPTSLATFDQMPGELTGLDSEGDLNALATYGMMAVELQNEIGDYLSLPEGTNAIIKMQVPEALLGSAPQIIPLWHFNEQTGNWEEEGEAELIGSEYVCEVSHFSFWNCDVPFPLVEISGNITLDGQPYENGLLKITDLSSGFCSFGYTGARGFFSGKVPEGNNLELSIVGICNSEAEDFEIGPFFENTNIGSLSATGTLEVITIQGTFSNCFDEDFELAFVIVESLGSEQSVEVNSDGSFSLEIPACLNDEITIYGFDLTNSLSTEEEIFDVSDVSNLELVACLQDSFSEFDAEYDGMNWDPQHPSFNLSYEIDTLLVDGETEFYFQINGTGFDPNINDIGELFSAEFWYTPGEEVGTYSFNMISEGFSFEGECEILLPGFSEYPIIIINGVYFGEPNVVNVDVYPGDIEVVGFLIVIPNF